MTALQMLRQSVDDQLNEPEEAHFLMRIMHPYDEFRVRWDSFVLVAMMHAVVCIPFEICFDYNAPMLHIFTLVSLAMDIFLICDCALNFRTGYVPAREGVCVDIDLERVFDSGVCVWNRCHIQPRLLLRVACSHRTG